MDDHHFVLMLTLGVTVKLWYSPSDKTSNGMELPLNRHIYEVTDAFDYLSDDKKIMPRIIY